MAIITISRGTKSGGVALAQCLSQRLGYSCKSREVILEGAKKYNIMAEDLIKRLEESPGLWQRLTREHERFLIFLKCALIDAVKEDNVIYHGYAGQLFLRGVNNVLRVRLDAPIEERAKAIMEETGKSFDEARAHVARIDDQRTRWVKSLYGEQWRDPSLYDISFSTEHLTIQSICEIVALAVDREEFRTSEQSKRRLQDLSLECEVKAAFASDDEIWKVPVDVTAEDGVVTLRGMIKDKKLREVFAGIASQVKGVQECKVDINLTTDPLTKGVYGHD